MSRDRVRYRLLPYLYSLAGAVTQQGGTMMRPLVMDFRGDASARDRQNQDQNQRGNITITNNNTAEGGKASASARAAARAMTA